MSSETNGTSLRTVFDLLNMKSDHCNHKESCAKNFGRQLMRSAGTGMVITLGFRLLRHIRNIGRPWKMYPLTSLTLVLLIYSTSTGPSRPIPQASCASSSASLLEAGSASRNWSEKPEK